MKPPFEKFVVQFAGGSSFVIYTGAPERVRQAEGPESSGANLENMRQSYLFIEDAIREKLEREAPPEAPKQ